jgi:hypothetical protein
MSVGSERMALLFVTLADVAGASDRAAVFTTADATALGVDFPRPYRPMDSTKTEWDDIKRAIRTKGVSCGFVSNRSAATFIVAKDVSKLEASKEVARLLGVLAGMVARRGSSVLTRGDAPKSGRMLANEIAVVTNAIPALPAGRRSSLKVHLAALEAHRDAIQIAKVSEHAQLPDQDERIRVRGRQERK